VVFARERRAGLGLVERRMELGTLFGGGESGGLRRHGAGICGGLIWVDGTWTPNLRPGKHLFPLLALCQRPTLCS